MPILTQTQIDAFAAAHPAWSVQDNSITRTFIFEDFAEALGFVIRVGVAAERVFHHPDIDVRWNKVTLAPDQPRRRRLDRTRRRVGRQGRLVCDYQRSTG